MSKIEIIPAIDIIEGRCVRLSQGDYDRRKVYDESPVDMAKRYADCGVNLFLPMKPLYLPHDDAYGWCTKNCAPFCFVSRLLSAALFSVKQQRKPKYSTRAYTRCRICGRPHSVLRKYGICRICFRELAYKGEIPGVRKASW